MKLPEGCNFKKGFTFIELIIVLAILGILIASSTTVAVRFYQTRALDIHLNGIVQVLRRAQLKAMSVENDSSFGVYINSDKYVLFKGDSYSTRDQSYDETYNLPDNFKTSGLSEVVFSKIRGNTSDTGNIILTVTGKSKTLNINKVGRINH